MDATKINFRLPNNLLFLLDEEALKEHRDRTSMLIKIIADHYKDTILNNGIDNRNKKKAGSR